MKQFTQITAKMQFSLKLEKGRPCFVNIGDVFVVTNPEHMQDKGIKVARRAKARLNQGYLLEMADVVKLFSIEE